MFYELPSFRVTNKDAEGMKGFLARVTYNYLMTNLGLQSGYSDSGGWASSTVTLLLSRLVIELKSEMYLSVPSTNVYRVPYVPWAWL